MANHQENVHNKRRLVTLLPWKTKEAEREPLTHETASIILVIVPPVKSLTLGKTSCGKLRGPRSSISRKKTCKIMESTELAIFMCLSKELRSQRAGFLYCM